MTGPPMVVPGRRRQLELLRSWSGWALTSILLEPAEVAHVREGGWAGTHHRNQDTGERIVGTRDGLGFGVDESWRNPREVIAWSQIEEIAREVPTEVRDELVEFRARWRAHQSPYPRFTASAAAVGCGPVIPGEPLTPRQEAYVREYEEFEASGVLPAWEQQKTALEAERLGLHDRALRSGSVEEEPGDLLELPENQELGRAAAAAPAGEPLRQTDCHATTLGDPDEGCGAAAPRPGLFPPNPQTQSRDELSPESRTASPRSGASR
ncbi:MAG: hypothetical protein CMH82_01500 [Nocardioides sp.]|nr:hypothetical protein [Nocardioides sp.]